MLDASLETLGIACQATKTLGPKNRIIKGIYTDTREPIEDGLFLAIKGEHFDGHHFAETSLRQNAAGILVERANYLELLKEFPNAVGLLVDCTRRAYLDIAAHYRQKRDQIKWLAVTGSVGKSTVKEMVAHVLAQGGNLNVHWAAKSFNNEIGVPKTILDVQPDHDVAVVEIGTNHPGEIATLSKVTAPEIVIITNAGASHLEFFHTVAGVAKEKGAILDYQLPNGTAILNADDPFFNQWVDRARGRVISFGLNANANVRAEAIEQRPGRGAFFFLCYENQALEIQMQVPGKHNVLNALATAATSIAAGLTPEEIKRGLQQFNGMERRFQRFENNKITIIDDAYNASPASFAAALQAVQNFAGRRLFVIAGDMLELGGHSEKFHDQLGQLLAEAGPEALLTVGPWAHRAGITAVRYGLPNSSFKACATPEEAAERIKPLLREGDVILVKGSNGMRLHRCVARLRENIGLAAA